MPEKRRFRRSIELDSCDIEENEVLQAVHALESAPAEHTGTKSSGNRPQLARNGNKGFHVGICRSTIS